MHFDMTQLDKSFCSHVELHGWPFPFKSCDFWTTFAVPCVWIFPLRLHADPMLLTEGKLGFASTLVVPVSLSLLCLDMMFSSRWFFCVRAYSVTTRTTAGCADSQVGLGCFWVGGFLYWCLQDSKWVAKNRLGHVDSAMSTWRYDPDLTNSLRALNAFAAKAVAKLQINLFACATTSKDVSTCASQVMVRRSPSLSGATCLFRNERWIVVTVIVPDGLDPTFFLADLLESSSLMVT